MSKRNRTEIRQINILCEYDYSYELALLMKKNELPISNENLITLKSERDEYFDLLPKSKDFSSTYSEYKNLCNIAVQGTFKNILELSKEFKKIEITNFNRAGRLNGVCDKSDTHISINENNFKFSLKLYSGNSESVQIASGTYLSTLCGLAFEPIGVGKYLMPNNKTFNSSNHDKLIAAFSETYGSTIIPLLDNLKDLDKIFKPLVKEKYCGDDVWKEICKNVGNLAIPLMIGCLDIIKNNDEQEFTKRLLKRTGLTGEDEIILVINGKFYTSMGNQKAKQIFGRLNSSEIFTSYCQSGKDQQGKGIAFSFCDSQGTILSWDMPLTINKNGAWQLDKIEGRDCGKEGFILFGDPRPLKSKEIATSTNCWIKIGEIFK